MRASPAAPAVVHPTDEVPRRSAVPAAVLGACLLAYLTVGAFLSRQGEFWSPDQAIRFVQMESLWRLHYRDVAVPYPAAALDPEGRFFPAMEWFHFQQNGKQYLSYLPYFPMASAPLYHAFGYAGLLILPLAAGLTALWITVGVLRARAPGWLMPGAIALAFGTPLLLYSAVFWDHSLGVALAAGALALACRGIDGTGRPRRDLVAAGALLGFGLWLRNELYVLTLALVLGWMVAGTGRRLPGLAALVAGLAAPVGLLWGLNAHLYGTPLGWKGQGLVASRVHGTIAAAAGSGRGVWLSDKLANAYYQLVSPNYYAFNPHAVAAGLALAAGLLLAGILLRSGIQRRSERLITAGGGLGLVIGLAILSGRTTVSGLLPSAPFVILALLPGPLTRWERFCWLVIGFFGIAVILTGTHGGLQWGPRYLLPIFPALVWLAAASAARARAAAPTVWPALRLAAGALIIVSVMIQVSGVDQVSEAMARNASINGALRAAPSDIVVTPLDWLTISAGPVYFEKALMLVRSPEEFHALVHEFSAKRVARWTYIPYSGPLFAPSAVERWVTDRPWRFSIADDRVSGGLRLVTYGGAPGPQ